MLPETFPISTELNVPVILGMDSLGRLSAIGGHPQVPAARDNFANEQPGAFQAVPKPSRGRHVLRRQLSIGL